MSEPEKKKEDMIPKVFLVEPNDRFVLTSAETFGEILYLTESRLDPFNLPVVIDSIYDGFIACEFNPKTDYVCMTGNTLVLAVMLAVAVSLYDNLRLLMFDARTSKYRERTMESPRLKGKENEQDDQEGAEAI